MTSIKTKEAQSTTQKAIEARYERDVIQWEAKQEHKLFLLNNTVVIPCGYKMRSKYIITRVPHAVVKAARCNEKFYQSDSNPVDIAAIFTVEVRRPKDDRAFKVATVGYSVDGENSTAHMLTNGYLPPKMYNLSDLEDYDSLIAESGNLADEYDEQNRSNELGREYRKPKKATTDKTPNHLDNGVVSKNTKL